MDSPARDNAGGGAGTRTGKDRRQPFPNLVREEWLVVQEFPKKLEPRHRRFIGEAAFEGPARLATGRAASLHSVLRDFRYRPKGSPIAE